MSHAVSNQRLSALDDVSLDTTVVIPPLPKNRRCSSTQHRRLDEDKNEHQSHQELVRIPFMPP